MAWSVAHNLDVRRGHVIDKWPGTTVYTIGDTSHQSGQSDHNCDARDIVHALDVMTYSDTAKGQTVVDWCMSERGDLEYVIFNRTIRSRSYGWEPRPYTGSDPHTDHVHISGKHGSTGYTSATGTGYDTAAEAMTPQPIGGDMDTNQANQLTDVAAILFGMANGVDEVTVHDKDGRLSLTPFYDRIGESVVKRGRHFSEHAANGQQPE